MYLKQITDDALAQNAYLIGCQRTGEAIVIDPERDVDRYLELAAAEGLRIVAAADTHIHADYLSGMRELMEHHGARGYVTVEGGPDWQMEWAKGHSLAKELRNGDKFGIGNIEFEAVLTPGHTPEHLSYLVTDHGGGADEPIAFLTGDFIFVGDVGRPDLLESAAGVQGAMLESAEVLYESLRATRSLPEFLQILPAHGAGSACGKALGAIPYSVMGYERRYNKAFRQALVENRESFVGQILEGQPEPPAYFARMKRDNRDGQPLLPEGLLPVPKRFKSPDLESFMKQAAGLVLDLRADKLDFIQGHVKGVLWTPLDGTSLPEAVGSFVLDEKTPLVLLVERESDLDEAVRQLVRIGYDQTIAWMPVAEAIRELGAQGLPSIRSQDLSSTLEREPGRVLDVRRTSEYELGHFANAIQIAHTRLATRIEELPRNETLYVHCRSGSRAAKSAAYLLHEGFNVVHVDGPVEALISASV